jgi:hypothetical protein
MSMPTNHGYKFPEKLIKKMIDSINKSNEINQKIEFSLFAKDNIIFCGSDCERNEKVGSFRVYPNENHAIHCTEDIIAGYKYGITCVGATKDISCMIRKEDYKDEVCRQIQDIINRSNHLEKSFNESIRTVDEFLARYIKSEDIEIVDILLAIDELTEVLEFEEFSPELGEEPGILLGEFVLPVSIVKKMKDLVIKSEKIGKEICLDFCADSENIIIARNEFIGEEDCVRTYKNCKKGEVFLGAFHTHPYNDKVGLSIEDLIGLYLFGIVCIGTRNDIKAYICNKFDKKDLEFLKNLNRTIRHLDKEIIKIQKEKFEFGDTHFDRIGRRIK